MVSVLWTFMLSVHSLMICLLHCTQKLCNLICPLHFGLVAILHFELASTKRTWRYCMGYNNDENGLLHLSIQPNQPHQTILQYPISSVLLEGIRISSTYMICSPVELCTCASKGGKLTERSSLTPSSLYHTRKHTHTHVHNIYLQNCVVKLVYVLVVVAAFAVVCDMCMCRHSTL